ncbi:hypothetical protein TNCV_3445211 [Trichonephila clavipes]|nr:hypothetical protein TNCV_3445211 [Trichonephila clavipes]
MSAGRTPLSMRRHIGPVESCEEAEAALKKNFSGSIPETSVFLLSELICRVSQDYWDKPYWEVFDITMIQICIAVDGRKHLLPRCFEASFTRLLTKTNLHDPVN